MSFLKQEKNQKVNNIAVQGGKQDYPTAYSASETMVQLTPVPKPTSTQLYDHNSHSDQKVLCDKLVQSDSALFETKNTIVKTIAKENQYKQRQQYSSRSSVESLCDMLETNNLVLKASFVRPGFSASNTCLMCTPAQLRNALENESDNYNLKKLRINLESDSNLNPENGTMYLSLMQQPSGKHVIYSLDYHVAEKHDNKLFCK